MFLRTELKTYSAGDLERREKEMLIFVFNSSYLHILRTKMYAQKSKNRFETAQGVVYLTTVFNIKFAHIRKFRRKIRLSFVARRIIRIY